MEIFIVFIERVGSFGGEVFAGLIALIIGYALVAVGALGSLVSINYYIHAMPMILLLLVAGCIILNLFFSALENRGWLYLLQILACCTILILSGNQDTFSPLSARFFDHVDLIGTCTRIMIGLIFGTVLASVAALISWPICSFSQDSFAIGTIGVVAIIITTWLLSMMLPTIDFNKSKNDTTSLIGTWSYRQQDKKTDHQYMGISFQFHDDGMVRVAKDGLTETGYYKYYRNRLYINGDSGELYALLLVKDDRIEVTFDYTDTLVLYKQ